MRCFNRLGRGSEVEYAVSQERMTSIPVEWTIASNGSSWLRPGPPGFHRLTSSRQQIGIFHRHLLALPGELDRVPPAE
jgi:hypothetical protein